MLAGGWGAVVGSLKGKKQLWGIAGECEERSLNLVGAVMGIGVGSEVGEREREQSKNRGRPRGEGSGDRGALGEVGILWENLPWGWRLILESLGRILEGED